MKNNEMNTNIENDIMNPATWTEQDRQFLDAVKDLTSEQKDLLLEIMTLVEGNPARMELASNWQGNMKDLPTALAQI